VLVCAGGRGPGTCPVNPPTWNWFPSTNARSCCFDAVGALTPHIMSLPNNLPPGFVLPAQPVEREAPPAGADWVHEIKHDGYRMIVRRDGERVRLFSRKAIDWTERLPAIAAAAAVLRPRASRLTARQW
jgi:hypothetical protein